MYRSDILAVMYITDAAVAVVLLVCITWLVVTILGVVKAWIARPKQTKINYIGAKSYGAHLGQARPQEAPRYTGPVFGPGSDQPPKRPY